MIQKVENNHTLQPANIYTPFLLFKDRLSSYRIFDMHIH